MWPVIWSKGKTLALLPGCIGPPAIGSKMPVRFWNSTMAAMARRKIGTHRLRSSTSISDTVVSSSSSVKFAISHPIGLTIKDKSCEP
jgi:hypothetical protein